MLKIYICPLCGATRIISNNHDSFCAACNNTAMVCTDLPYEKYVNMDSVERKQYTSLWLANAKKANP